MSKETAVEWLEEELAKKLKSIVLNQDYQLMETLFEQAKAMEKEQMIDFAQMWEDSPLEKYDCKEDLYNEIYGGDE
jgi:hypothetical protein